MNNKLITVVLTGLLAITSLACGCSQDATDIQSTVKGMKNGVLNHGHSISETSTDRPNELRRTDDVIMDEVEALKYLEDTVTLPDSDMRFFMSETSDNDPGAYMWYGFDIYKDNICITNSRFTVVAFTDGTICEGRLEVLSCAVYADPDDMISPDEALDIYKKGSGDARDFLYCFDHNYIYRPKTNECILTYTYRYDCGRPLENTTLLLNAMTGEKEGIWTDAVT